MRDILNARPQFAVAFIPEGHSSNVVGREDATKLLLGEAK